MVLAVPLVIAKNQHLWIKTILIMKSTIRQYGLYGLITSTILFQVAFLIGKGLSYQIQETLGYLTIAISLLFVFFAIKHYRDKENHGNLTILNGLIIGISITLFVAIGSAIADYLYVTVWYPDFATDYTNYQLEKLKPVLSQQDFELKKIEMLDNLKTLGNPLVMALVMFITVICLGTIITILSALFLQKKQAPSYE